MKPNKKAQIITFDFSSSIIIFMIFIIIFIGLFLLSQTVEKKQEFELEYMFANLENNLKFGPGNQNFFSDYRVNKGRLDDFINAFYDKSIDSYVVGNISGDMGVSHGIGLDEANYDVCLYFTDNDNRIVSIDPDTMRGTNILGWLEKPGKKCTEGIAGGKPCDKYSQAISFFKPVLFDEGPINNPENNNRILQMNILICKR
jgi:hypothetical protein